MAEVWGPHCLTLAVSEEPIPLQREVIVARSLLPVHLCRQALMNSKCDYGWHGHKPAKARVLTRDTIGTTKLLNFGSHLYLHPFQIHFSCLFSHLGPAHRSIV